MSKNRLYQNRVYVLGADYNDARLVAQRHPAVKGTEVSIVSATSHRLTILGSISGAHIGKVFVTPAAHRGEHYELARETFQRVLTRTGGEFVHLDAEGGTYGSL